MTNIAVIQGRFTKDPEVRTTQSGISVCSFTIANDSGYGDSRRTNFIPCTVWRKTADFVGEYFAKGSLCVVTGSVQQREYTDRDGNKRQTTEIIATDVAFCEKKAAEGSNGNGERPKEALPTKADFDEVDSDEDLPF